MQPNQLTIISKSRKIQSDYNTSHFQMYQKPFSQKIVERKSKVMGKSKKKMKRQTSARSWSKKVSSTNEWEEKRDNEVEKTENEGGKYNHKVEK